MPSVPVFEWTRRAEFLNRDAALDQLQDWWETPGNRLIVNVHGRRRVGKSWLLRAFAHGKPAIVLVADQIAQGAQLVRFAEALEPFLGVRPSLPDVTSLFRVLYSLGEAERCLVVIDEFPYLLPSRPAARTRLLSSIQAELEDLVDDSQTKLMLCGSHVAQMEMLLTEGSPLRGRMHGMSIKPLSFYDAMPFLQEHAPGERITRYAVAGGMPRYLHEFSGGRSLAQLLPARMLDPYGPLFNEPREILEQEFSQPAVYFSVLEALADGDKRLDEIAVALQDTQSTVSRYLDTLQAFRIVERRVPITADPRTYRGSRYHLRDPFFRLWFRFNFPHQAALEDGGLSPSDLYTSLVAPNLADHAAPVFEELARSWIARTYGASIAQRVGSWWGNALPEHRSSGERTSEEIDVVGVKQQRVTLIGECKWTNAKLGLSVLTDLERYKLAALRREARVVGEPQIVLFSRSGFGSRLQALAESRDDLRLVGVDEMVR